MLSLTGMLGAHENLAQVAAPNIEIVIPDFVDCSGPEHSDWHDFRSMFEEVSEHASARSEDAGRPSFPSFHPSLAREAHRLYKKWYGHEVLFWQQFGLCQDT